MLAAGSALNVLSVPLCVGIDATLPCKTVALKNCILHCRPILKRLMTMNNYTIKSFVVLIRTF